MERGSLPDTHWPDRAIPGYKVYDITKKLRPVKTDAPAPLQVFGNSGLEHMEKYGTQQHHFTMIAAKNKRHSTNNPYSQFQKEMTVEQIDAYQNIYGMLNLHHCCPTSAKDI
jgi:sterol carrier protein 2